MGLLNRLKDLFQANVSDMLNKSEDPEKMLNLYIYKAFGDVRNFQIQVNRAKCRGNSIRGAHFKLTEGNRKRSEQAILASQANIALARNSKVGRGNVPKHKYSP